MKRLRNLVLMECLLNALLKLYQLPLPELCFSLENSRSPVSKPESKRKDEKSMQGTSSIGYSLASRGKRGRRPGATKNSECNGKIRQPTILEVLKKSGTYEEQEEKTETASRSHSAKSPDCTENEEDNSDGLGCLDVSAAPKYLDAQRSRFRPLLIDSLCLLSFSEKQDTCYQDPAAELPCYLYLIRDFCKKLDYFIPPSKHCFPAASTKDMTGYCTSKTSDFFNKTRPLFASLRKHLDGAVSILKSDKGPEGYPDPAGNPDMPDILFSYSSIASSVSKEILCCYSKMLSLSDLFLQINVTILRDLLEALQPTKKAAHLFSGLQVTPAHGSIEFLYCGAYSVLEDILDKACSSSFLLASEVLSTLQSLLNSIEILIAKTSDRSNKAIKITCASFLPSMKKVLGLSAHKLLIYKWDFNDTEGEWKSKGDAVQKMLQIYLRNSESTSDLLEEFALLVSQVPSWKSGNETEASNDFSTLSPMTLLVWYRVLHEENLEALSKLVKEIRSQSKISVSREAVEKLLTKIFQTIRVIVSLVETCKKHDKVTMHALSVKYGGRFVDTFLRVFYFLQSHFQVHNEIIIQMVKELQKATRTIQTLCSEAKGLKRTSITNKIPATKRSMERYLFHVKALLHNTSNGCSFWMGNLKHKDLSGNLVSSQVYNYTEDEQVENIGDEGEEDQGDER